MLTEKENAERIIGFGNPDRVGTHVPMQLISYLGCNHEGYQEKPNPDSSVWEDIWGTTWRLESEYISEMPVNHPISDGWSSVEKYRWPDPDDDRLVSKIYQDLETIQDDQDSFLTGFHRDLLLEKGSMLAGMQNLMIWFKTDSELVKFIFQRIMDFQLGIAKHYLACNVEMVKFGEDLGGQTSALFSHEVFEKFLLPEYKRIFNFYKGKNIKVYFHSCGQIENFIDDFINLGVDILNPVQATANNLVLVRERTMGKIALEGGVNSSIIMQADKTALKKEVLHRLLQLGSDGGYFCCPDQKMPYPEKNIQFIDFLVNKFGKYPLNNECINEELKNNSS